MRASSARPPVAAGHDRPIARAVLALVLSGGLNMAALAAVAAAGALRPPAALTPASVGLAALGAERWETNRRVLPLDEGGTPPAPHRSPARQPPSPPVPDGRVVRVAPSPDPRRPPHARFLAERDNAVERETQWRGASKPGAALAARPTSGAAGERGVPLPGEEGDSEESAPGRLERTADKADGRIERARLALSGDGERAAGGGDVRDGTRSDERGARRAGRFDPRILPVGAAYGAAAGGSPAADRLPGVAAGDATAVNTRAFRYADFYQRVREAIAVEWDPNRAWDARDPHDRVLGRVTRKVLVDIVLDTEGELREARLVRGSGIDFFDRECLRAISAAAPFPNPPRGLVGSDGLVVLRGWGLVFEWGPEALLDRLLPNR